MCVLSIKVPIRKSLETYLIIFVYPKIQSLEGCDTVRSVSVCGYQSENYFVCFGAKPTQRACARDLLRDRMWVKGGRKIREKTVSWQRRPEEVSQQKGAEELSRLETAVKRRTQSTEVSMASSFYGGFARVHARVSSQNARKVSRNSLSCTCICLFLFFHPLGYVFWVSVKECVMPLVGDERNH